MAGGAVGLVLGSVSAADRAIATVVRGLLDRSGVPHETIDAVPADPSRYRLLVVGSGGALGGALPGGPHVLNAAGLADGADAAALGRYLYVSVRTSEDRARIGAARDDAAVVPSLILGLHAEAPGRTAEEIGVHLDGPALATAPHWHEPLRALGGGAKRAIALAPAERGRLARLLHAAGPGELVAPDSPAGLVEALGGLRLLVSASIPFAALALRLGVPTLLVPSEPGAEAYFRDRGLAPWIVRTPEDVARRAPLLLDAAPDYAEIAARDEARLEAHLSLLREVLSRPAAVAVPEALRAPPGGAPRFRFDAPAGPAVDSPGRDAEVRLRAFVTRLGSELDRLHAEIASQRRRIDELAAEVDRLQGEVLRREELLEAMRRSRAWRFAVRVQELLARFAGRGSGA